MLKGVGMGIANVIPGVSGGTIALITGIFERLIHALKSFDLKALKLILKGNIREFASHTDLYFLLCVFAGVLVAVFSVARLFDYLFTHFPVYIWSYFFGLILASVYYVGRSVEKWTTGVVLALIAGTAIAIVISVLNPAVENRNFFYLILCGIAGVCSMILPGISGSFMLLLMGNYHLIAIEAVNTLNFSILMPVAMGIIVGLIGFSHFLSWVFRKFKNQTIGILTGFILGSLLIIWPWKEQILALDPGGNVLMKGGVPLVERYEAILPETFSAEVITAMVISLLGVGTIYLIETLALEKK